RNQNWIPRSLFGSRAREHMFPFSDPRGRNQPPTDSESGDDPMLRTSGKCSNTLCSSRQCDLLIIPKNRTFGTGLNFSGYGVNQACGFIIERCVALNARFNRSQIGVRLVKAYERFSPAKSASTVGRGETDRIIRFTIGLDAIYTATLLAAEWILP